MKWSPVLATIGFWICLQYFGFVVGRNGLGFLLMISGLNTILLHCLYVALLLLDLHRYFFPALSPIFVGCYWQWRDWPFSLDSKNVLSLLYIHVPSSTRCQETDAPCMVHLALIVVNGENDGEAISRLFFLVKIMVPVLTFSDQIKSEWTNCSTHTMIGQVVCCICKFYKSLWMEYIHYYCFVSVILKLKIISVTIDAS